MGDTRLIYFDNAATTLTKPRKVYEAVGNAMKMCANAGRGGYKPSLYAAKKVLECREEIADLFHISSPERVVFTYNATHALNLAIKSILHNGGHALVSSIEHNSVMRPLVALKDKGVTYSVVNTPIFDIEKSIYEFRNAIRSEKPNCVILSHISNVFGYEMPIYLIDEICYENDVPMILDASQSAGYTMIDATKLKSVSFICMPGHKGLLGPQGTGILLVCNDKKLYSTIQGGTGSFSSEFAQPEFLPDIFESGTLNVPGICGLCEGVKYIKSIGFRKIQNKSSFLLECMLNVLNDIEGVKVYTGSFHKHGVVSFSVGQMDSEEVCMRLAEYDICVRGGLHCSPLAHQTAGTTNMGLVRASFSFFNIKSEIDIFALKLKKILCKKSTLFY